MSSSDHASRIARATELLRGYPVGTAEAAAQFLGTGSDTALDRLFDLVLSHHVAPRPDRPPISALPSTTRLVEDLGVNSFALVEMVFLLEQLFSRRFSDDELRALRTLGDLRAVVRTNGAAISGR